MTEIYIDNNFITQQQVDKLYQYVQSTTDWVITNDSWSERFIFSFAIHDKEIKREIENIAQSVVDLIKQKEHTSVVVETCQLVRWRKGDKLDPPHADCEHLDGSPHPYPNRHYSVLIYLNKDYEGGQIFFPNQQLTPKTLPGTLVQFKGTKEYLHGVTEITNGERYTIVMFLTKND